MYAHYYNKIQEINKYKELARRCNDIELLYQYLDKLQYEDRMFIDNGAEAQAVKKVFDSVISDIKTDIQQIKLKPKEDNITPPSRLTCILEYTPEKLEQLHGLLIDSLMIKRGDPLNNFLYVFGACARPENWQTVNWIGSNPKLATLVFKLTDEKKEHETINMLFKTKTKYQRMSENRTDNIPIKKLLSKVNPKK